jgi:hypothetical protein
MKNIAIEGVFFVGENIAKRTKKQFVKENENAFFLDREIAVRRQILSDAYKRCCSESAPSDEVDSETKTD